jgi:ribose-phosphate pyrophosphokinase
LLGKQLSHPIVVSPDIGGVARARAFAKQLYDAPLAIIDKRRPSENPDQSIHIIGDVHGKTAIVIDDMVDTGRTLADCALALRRAGAYQVYACATHPLFSSLAHQHLFGDLFEEVIVTNTIPVAEGYQGSSLTVLSIASLLGETIYRTHQENPVNRWLQGH